MKISDLHSHPSLKPYLRDKPGTRYWKKKRIVIDALMDNILDSQSSLDQIWKVSEGAITIIALHPFEKEFGKQMILQKLARFNKNANEALLDAVVDGSMAYHDLLDIELNLLKKHLKSGNKRVNIINKSNKQINPHAINVVLTVEGGHAFCSQNEIRNDNSAGKSDSLQKGIDRFKAFRDEHFPMFITLTHIAFNYYCNQAYALPNLMIGFPFRRKDFLPKSNGIHPKGVELINEALEGDPNKRVLIDIKQMSLVSRTQYYEMIKNKNIPILASHMGVTGISRTEIGSHIWKLLSKHNRVRVRYKTVPAYAGHTQFNPNSINLYDEDIVTIMQSKGLIGVSMDERILGSSNSKFGEFVFPEEFETAFIGCACSSFLNDNPTCKDEEEDNVQLEDEGVVPVGENDIVTERHSGGDINYLANNIIHILKVGFQNNIDQPWKYITIGSDYDGLINPIDKNRTKRKSVTVELIPDLLKQLPGVLIDVASTAGIKTEISNNIGDIIECYVYKNLEDFVVQHYL